MDDLELEARLRTHLHRRFDDTPVPSGLTANVSRALTTAARPVGRLTPIGRHRLGWVAVAASVIVAVAAIGVGRGLGPAGPRSTATPAPSPSWTRDFIVLPPTGAIVAKPDSSLAIEVMNDRLRALGVGTFESAGGDGLEFFLPQTGPSDASIRAVLAATGDVRIVPLLPADYGQGKLTATIGAPLPKDEPTLIGWDGIASATIDPLGGSPNLSILLKPAATAGFAAYTAAHVGETFAIVVDGRVALLPMVLESITSGQITISPAGGDAFAEAAAIMAGGMLPEAWRGAQAPPIVPQQVAIAAAMDRYPTATMDTIDPGVVEIGAAWRAVWTVGLMGAADGSGGTSPAFVMIDAVSGTVLQSTLVPQPS